MDHSLQPFPPLSVEIFIAIVEAAASCRSTALTLSLVSKSVYRWTKPILYRSIHLSCRNVSRFIIGGFFAHNFSHNLMRTPKSLIRSLFVSECSGPGILHLVNHCEHLDLLMCNSDIIECTTTKSRPKEIIIYPSASSSTFHDDGGSIPPILQSVTHLFVQQEILDEGFVDDISSLERLTHLAVPFSDAVNGTSFIQVVKRLLEITSLQCIMITSIKTLDGSLWMQIAEISDQRLVVRAVDGASTRVAQKGGIWMDPGLVGNWREQVMVS